MPFSGDKHSFLRFMIASTQTNHPLANVAAAQDSRQALEQACARIKAAGLRITQPRVAILDALLRRAQPSTIEQIHSSLTEISCDLVTVYRCLAAFQEVGLVRLTHFHNGTSLYQMNLGNETAYHVVSKDSKEIEPLDEVSIAELRATLTKIEDRLKSRGYGEVSHIVEFFGQKVQQPEYMRDLGQVPTPLAHRQQTAVNTPTHKA